MNFKLVYSRVVFATCKAISLTGILLAGHLHAAQNSNALYMVALNSDGSRVGISKWQENIGWELFEGTAQQGFRKLRLPIGQQADSSLLYSPDGKNLLFTTATNPPAAEVRLKESGEVTERPATLWQQPVDGNGELAAKKIFERALPMSNVLPLTDGSFVFMGKVDEVKSLSWSPITGSKRVWSTYQWMLRQPNGAVKVLNANTYGFFQTASLIRDEAVFLVQERRSDGRPLNPREYYLDVVAFKPSADLSPLELLGNIKDRRGGPRLQCDWAGKTCARLMTFEKDGYHAHQLELIRDGKVCKVAGLPDRLEKMAISRNGNAVALIAKPTPRKSGGHKLAYVVINAAGCADSTKFLELP